MSKTQPALTKRTSSRVRAALAAAVALASVFGSHVACSETAGSGAALGTMRILADAYDNIQPDFAFDIVPTNEMARIKGAARTSSLRLILPENQWLVALPIEAVTSSVKRLRMQFIRTSPSSPRVRILLRRCI